MTTHRTRAARVAVGLALAVLSGACGNLPDLIESAPCVASGGEARMCLAGEDVGHLPGTTSVHCCEDRLFQNDGKCTLIGGQQAALSAAAVAEFAGYFTGELNLDASVSYQIRLTLNRQHVAFHQQKPRHCPLHDTTCDDFDEVIRRKWDFDGAVEINSKVEAEAMARVQGQAAEHGVPFQGQVDMSQNRTMLTLGPFSLCEDEDHEACGRYIDATPGAFTTRDPETGEPVSIPWTPRE